ncbi:trigger factor [Candidatus Erwinia haradaeae]|uniref:Trigger factor n=1 Tax=Candidatus Erwinia haradaeae TaxID=1922217 RepID=A0A451DN64_9GAMM|nr:trigger factor [Candidatus Erwinia haradaeae]VFP88221.1 Trigger factor [Candidatus Erwinia haradaeae]
MKVLKKNIQNFNKSITLTIKKMVIEDTVKKKLAQIAKKSQIDGFRPGKAPLYIVEQRYGHCVRQEVINELMQRYFMDMMIHNQFHLFSNPVYIVLESENDTDFTFSVQCDMHPAIKIKGIENIKIEKPIITVTDSDVDSMIQILRQQQAIWKETNAPIRTKDRVTIKFSDSRNNNALPNLKESNLVLIIGNGQMSSIFEEGIIGHKTGEYFTNEVYFSQNYNNLELQGQTIKFNILVKKVETHTLPEINPDFIKKFGVKEGSLEILRAEVRQNMQRELNNAVRHFIKSQVINALVQTNYIEIPDQLVNNKMALWKNQTDSNYNNKAKKKENSSHMLSFEETKHNMLVNLLFTQVIYNYNITANKERVRILIEDIASAYDDPKEVVAQYQANTNLMKNIYNTDLEEQAVEAILRKAQIIEKRTTFEKFMHPPIKH